MSDRGMVKWMPYQSLVEQTSFLARMRYEKNKKPRPHISSDRAREINEILVTYEGEEVARLSLRPHREDFENRRALPPALDKRHPHSLPRLNRLAAIRKTRQGFPSGRL